MPPFLLFGGTFVLWLAAKGRLPVYAAFATVKNPGNGSEPKPGGAGANPREGVSNVGSTVGGPLGGVALPALYDVFKGVFDFGTGVGQKIGSDLVSK